MGQTTIVIEHIVVASSTSYEQVLSALEARLGSEESQKAVVQLLASDGSWEQILLRIKELSGSSGFTTFLKVDHGLLLQRSGKKHRATTYVIGNPLLAIEMTSQLPAVALYAPLRLAVYEDEENGAVVEYDSFASLVAQYNNEKVTSIAQFVDQRLGALVAEVMTAIPHDVMRDRWNFTIYGSG